eukprot:1159540-Pelagomonas_calceolata.AAC.3
MSGSDQACLRTCAQEIDEEQQGDGPGVDAIQMRSEYQVYKDAEYKPQRWIGPVDIQNIPEQARCADVRPDEYPSDKCPGCGADWAACNGRGCACKAGAKDA